MSYLIPIVTRYSCVIRDRWIRNVTYVFRVKNIGNSIRIKVKLLEAISTLNTVNVKVKLPLTP